jgi:microsomal prostaglandin-E synthase 2
MQQIATYYPEIEMENERGKTVYDYPNKYFLMYGRESGNTEKHRAEQKWRQWTDDVLVHTLSPNIYRTPRQALEAFQSFSVTGEWDRTFNVVERWFIIGVGATAMYFIGKLLIKRYNLKDDVRESLYDACNTWMELVKKNGQFMGGSEPNLADLAVYGELNAIEGCEAFRDLLHNTRIGAWYSATKQAIAANAGKREF